MKLIECVPNFSEGRDRAVIDAITARDLRHRGRRAARRRSRGGHQPHRGHLRRAARRRRRGRVPRDPQGGRADRHVEAPGRARRGWAPPTSARSSRCRARRWRTASSWPSGWAGGSARSWASRSTSTARRRTRPERVRLPDIRQGEYEALPEKLKDPDFAPDFGPAKFNARARRDRDRRPRVPDRLERQPQHPRQEAGQPDRRRAARDGQARSETPTASSSATRTASRCAQPGRLHPPAGRRLVHRGVRPGADLVQPDGLQRHRDPRGLRRLPARRRTRSACASPAASWSD